MTDGDGEVEADGCGPAPVRSTTQGYLLLTEKLKNDLVIEYQWLALAGYSEK